MFNETEKESGGFYFDLGDSRLVRKIVESIFAIEDEVVFTVNESGWEVLAMHPARSAMVDFFLPREVFDEFTLENENDGLSFGVNLRELLEVLKLAKREDSLRMQVVPGNGRLVLRLTSSSSRKEFHLPLVYLGGEVPKKLKIPFDFKVVFSTDLYRDIAKTAGAGGERVVFEATESQLVVKSSTYTREVRLVIPKDSPKVFSFSVSVGGDYLPVTAAYSTNFLKDFQKATGVSDEVTFEFSTKKPMRLTFPIPGGGHIAYALAPRLEY